MKSTEKNTLFISSSVHLQQLLFDQTQLGCPDNDAFNQIGGAARLAAPSSYRSTSAFEAIRANLAIPLGMALKMRSKWGCEASNLLCSAIRNNATIEGTWIFGGWRLCPSGRLCAHRSVQIHFFRPSKKQHTVEKGVIQNSGRTQL